MGDRVNYSGLLIAGIGFFLTRFTVTLAIYEEPLRFYLAGIVPLTLGLGLAAFGVALAVADVDPDMVRTTAAWCVIGAGTMLVLVLLTLLGSTPGDMPAFMTARSQAYLSNFLIGGSIGGTLTGLYASRNRRQRAELRQQANRLEVLNRMLRHEVLNALTVIRGYAPRTADGDDEAVAIIGRRSDQIQDTIEEVRFLAQSADPETVTDAAVGLGSCIRSSIETVTARHPEATFSVESIPDAMAVRANERLELVFVHLLENAIVHSSDPDPTVELSVSATPTTVSVSVTDRGPGLPERQQELLETGSIAEYDDTSAGFGLNVVRLLVESFRGDVETDVTGESTTITVVLQRAEDDEAGPLPLPTDISQVRPAAPHLVVTMAAAVVAGVVYGIVGELLGGSIAGIGVFYGTASPVVGWITHEFHSIVFGFVFAGLVSVAPTRYRTTVGGHVAIGLGWALVLWVVAAGIVAPVWLNLLGIPAGVPNLSPTLLATHIAWGISLGLFTGWGYEHASPWVGRRIRGSERLPTRH